RLPSLRSPHRASLAMPCWVRAAVWCSPASRFTVRLFFCHHPATTEISTLSLHDALPISLLQPSGGVAGEVGEDHVRAGAADAGRSEEHTSELQSHLNIVCRLLLEKKNTIWCTATGSSTV